MCFLLESQALHLRYIKFSLEAILLLFSFSTSVVYLRTVFTDKLLFCYWFGVDLPRVCVFKHSVAIWLLPLSLSHYFLSSLKTLSNVTKWTAHSRQNWSSCCGWTRTADCYGLGRLLDCTVVKIFNRIPQALCLLCLSGNSSSYPNMHLEEVFFTFQDGVSSK